MASSGPLFVSFATAQTPYEEELEHLLESLERFGLDHRCEVVANRGSWQANSAFRPTWLLRLMDELERPLVWIDADAVIRARPVELERSGFDFMAFFHPDGRPAGGTLYFAPTPGGRRLLAGWEGRARTPFERWPESHRKLTELHLRDAWREVGSELAVNRLEEPYLRIFDWGSGEPVVEHYQASRRFKRQVGDAQNPRHGGG